MCSHGDEKNITNKQIHDFMISFAGEHVQRIDIFVRDVIIIFYPGRVFLLINYFVDVNTEAYFVLHVFRMDRKLFIIKWNVNTPP